MDKSKWGSYCTPSQVYLSKALMIIIMLFSGSMISSQDIEKYRVIILTDIEADPDDTQSLVRLLLYANKIEIRGIIATTSCWLQNEIHPESIERVIRAYGKVQPNLSIHERGYPTEVELMSLIKKGLPVYGLNGVGDQQDSEGSDWIIEELEREDDRPLWISVWGGVNTLAQSLHKIRQTKSPVEAQRLIQKIRVYTISDQDNSGNWIRNNFPNLFYIASPGDDYGSATWSAINSYIPGIDNSEISNEWFAQHIQQGHGPLGSIYPDVSWGVEGDTPAFLGLIPNGLNNPEHPNWGSWGGRYERSIPDYAKMVDRHSAVVPQPETRAFWTDASERFTPYLFNNYGRNVRLDTVTFENNKVSLWRWRDDFQNDFAARMDWCTKSYDDVNHPPIPQLSHANHLVFTSGEDFKLNARGSFDPDGDNLSFLWFVYPEAGTYEGDFSLGQPENAHHVYGTAPRVEEEETIHVILRVTDKGVPSLSRYERIIITVKPE